MATPKLKENDRVRRLSGATVLGIVKDVKSEVTMASVEGKEKGLMIRVQWDNGTLSYHTPETLEVVPQN